MIEAINKKPFHGEIVKSKFILSQFITKCRATICVDYSMPTLWTQHEKRQQSLTFYQTPWDR